MVLVFLCCIPPWMRTAGTTSLQQLPTRILSFNSTRPIDVLFTRQLTVKRFAGRRSDLAMAHADHQGVQEKEAREKGEKEGDAVGRVAGERVGEGQVPHWMAARTMPAPPPKLLTLVIVHRDGRVLLGMKKRGFGQGFYNGFGGKVEEGETIDEAASRELQEEAGVTPVDMSKRGILTFYFDHDPIAWEVHVYHVSEVLGDPCESEEMAPRWFIVSEIPYETMWPDDILWYPEFLKGRSFKGNFYFENVTTLVSHFLQVIHENELIM